MTDFTLNPKQQIHVAAAVIQCVNSRKILAVRKSSGDMAGYWEFPGGKQEYGELIQHSLVREIREELGVDIIVGECVGTSVHAMKDVAIVLHAYLVQRWVGEFKLTEHDSLRWLTEAELLNLHWSPADVPIVRSVQASYCR